MMQISLNNQQAPKLLLTIVEAAYLLGLGRSSVYELVMTRRLKSVKVGRRRLIPLRAIEIFVDELQAE